MSELIPGDNIELTRELWEQMLEEFENGVDLRTSRRFDYVLEGILEQLIANRGNLEIVTRKHYSEKQFEEADPLANQPRLF